MHTIKIYMWNGQFKAKERKKKKKIEKVLEVDLDVPNKNSNNK